MNASIREVAIGKRFMYIDSLTVVVCERVMYAIYRYTNQRVFSILLRSTCRAS